jgi:hypothetical protein
MDPEIGDIWIDEENEHSLVTEIWYSKELDQICVTVLCLNTGKVFSENTMDMFGDFFIERVG